MAVKKKKKNSQLVKTNGESFFRLSRRISGVLVGCVDMEVIKGGFGEDEVG